MEFDMNVNLKGYVDGVEECSEDDLLKMIQVLINNTFAGIEIKLRRLEDA